MNQNKLYTILTVLIILCSCNREKKENEQSITTTDTIKNKPEETISVNAFDNIIYSIPDTIKKSNAYFFSNENTKDAFELTIYPGKIKESKSVLQIVTAEKKIIYTRTFDSYFFIRNIYDPDIILPDGIADTEAYMKKYYASLTKPQIEACFKKSIDGFFENIYLIEDNKSEFFEGDWDDDIDKDFLKEVLSDPSIRLYDITCFDCDEGGEIIGYSRKKGEVISLLDHD